MVKSIEVNGQTLTADAWLDISLPPYLRGCLNGDPRLYSLPQQEYFKPGAKEALRLLFAYTGNGLRDELSELRAAAPQSATDAWPLLTLKELMEESAAPLGVEEALTHREARALLDDLREAVQCIRRAEAILGPSPSSFDAIMMALFDELDDRGFPQKELRPLELGADHVSAILRAESTPVLVSDIVSRWVEEPAGWCLLGVSKRANPGRGNLYRRVFIDRMSFAIRRQFDQPRHSFVALAATAIFQEDGGVSAEHVRRIYNRRLRELDELD